MPARAVSIITGTTPNTYVEAYTGQHEYDAPPGCDFIHFFTPEVGPFLATVTAPHPIVSATEVLDVGGIYSNFSNAVRIGSLREPSGFCDVVTLIPGHGGITAANNQVIIGGDLFYPQDTNLFGETGVPLDGLPEGVTFKNFLNLDGNNDPFFLATLQGTGVTAGNALTLATFSPNRDTVIGKSDASFEYPVNILVRVGDTVVTSGDNTKVVKAITTLTGSKGTLADGRWRNYLEVNEEDYEDSILVLLTFTDGSEGIFVIPADSDHSAIYAGSFAWTELPATGIQFNITGLEEDTITSFGLPSIDPDAYAVLANVEFSGSFSAVDAAKPLVTKTAANTASLSSSNLVLITGPANGSYGSYVLARKGDSVPVDANGNEWNGVTIAGFSDPVVGEEGEVACLVTLAGLPHGPITGVEYTGTATQLSLLANVGAAAPDISGTGTVGHWASFQSLVLPAVGFELYFDDFLARPGLAHPASSGPDIGESGPIFLATLKISGSDHVDASNDLGLWAVDGYGTLQLLFRSGQTVNISKGSTKRVRTFTALDAAPGSLGAATGYDGFGAVAVVATFTDGTSAMIYLEIPGVEIP
jgi:hypothetical protein